MSLLDDLKMQMKARDLTQAMVAERTGTTPAHVSRIFAGKTQPTLPLLQAIAVAVEADLVVVPRTRLWDVRNVLAHGATGAPRDGRTALDLALADA